MTRNNVTLEKLSAQIDEVKALAAEALTERDRLRHEITHDPLTSVLNRKGFDEQVAFWTAEGMPHITVALLDLDDFKTYNDTFGHLAGDQLLTVTASVLQALGRTHGGYTARLGGDEFAVVAPSMDADLGRTLSHGSTIAPLSIGVAAGGVENLPVLMEKADVSCYVAKRVTGTSYHYWEEGDKMPERNELDRRHLARASKPPGECIQ